MDDLGPAASYGLSRLLRGLSSSRAGVREGFFTCLVLLLRRLPALDTAAVLSAADQQLGDVSGDSRRTTEHRVARLLVAGAAVRAGRRSQLDRLTVALLHSWSHRAYMPPMVATFLEELILRVGYQRPVIFVTLGRRPLPLCLVSSSEFGWTMPVGLANFEE